ncbi:hypothetical protein E2C01_081031 [Portunus trituberculatus]|uniref:Uncharacterized protein n=1 Tax=Portunus trituberculatus TaxID=210409 RepID=A0A5B7IQW3_PORTR|nr:hypothetical protein [Portunus trituberculatus]
MMVVMVLEMCSNSIVMVMSRSGSMVMAAAHHAPLNTTCTIKLPARPPLADALTTNHRAATNTATAHSCVPSTTTTSTTAAATAITSATITITLSTATLNTASLFPVLTHS